MSEKDLRLSACYIKRAQTMLEQTRLTSLGQARWGEEEGPESLLRAGKAGMQNEV